MSTTAGGNLFAPVIDTAFEAFSRGQPADSLQILERVITMDPGNFDALNGAGIVSCHLQNTARAIAYFERAHAVNPFEPVCSHNLAELFLRANQPDKAAACIARTLQKHPNDTHLLELNHTISERRKLQQIPLTLCSRIDLCNAGPDVRQRDGDHWFSLHLKQALLRRGAVLDPARPAALLLLHGAMPRTLPPDLYAMLWIHSHPHELTPAHLSLFDHIFSLSPSFTGKLQTLGFPAETLIGGTACTPPAERPATEHGIVFVGNARRLSGKPQSRPILDHLLALGGKWLDRLEVWGSGWEGILPAACIKGPSYDNRRLSELYAASSVVLNDHHEDMRTEGFLNPRLLDVMASGGLVISDELHDHQRLFGDALLTCGTPQKLDELLTCCFEDSSFRDRFIQLGRQAVRQYNFDHVADTIVRHLLTIDPSDHFRKILSRHPDQLTTRLRFAERLLGSNKHAEAREQIVIAWKQNPNHEDVLRLKTELERYEKLARLPLALAAQPPETTAGSSDFQWAPFLQALKQRHAVFDARQCRVMLTKPGDPPPHTGPDRKPLSVLLHTAELTTHVAVDYMLGHPAAAETPRVMPTTPPLQISGSPLRAGDEEAAADALIEWLLQLDEDALEQRDKNHYMNTVWAPVRGKIATDRIGNLKKVTAESCVGTVLDIGCANGDSTALMQKHNPALQFTGLELTDWAVADARTRHPEIPFVQGHAAHLPFPDQSFDTAVLDHVLEHQRDPVPALLEARRVARKRVVVGLPIMHLGDPDHKYAWSVEEARALLKGFFPVVTLRGMREPDGVEILDESAFNFIVAIGHMDPAKLGPSLTGAPVKLHLGCGNKRLPGCINIDMISTKATDLVCDARRLPFPAESVARIETYHMIEHLPRHSFSAALIEWNRVMELGADLIIECPDFEETVRQYVAGNKFRINNIFGLQRHEGDYHRFGYTLDSLREALQHAGFGNIRAAPPTDSHTQEEPCLRIEAIKVCSVMRPPNGQKHSVDRVVQTYQQALIRHRNNRDATP